MASYDTHWQSRGRKKRAAQVRWGKLLLLPGIILGLTLLTWALVRSPLLDVEEVAVAGAAHVEESAVIEAAQAVPSGFIRRMITRANLLGWPGTLPENAVSLVPGAKEIGVSRGFFTGTLTLTVIERDPAGVWCFEATGTPVCQWFDDEGVVYGRAYVSQGSLVTVVHDRSQEKAGEGRRVLPSDELRNFLAIMSVLKPRGVSAREIVIAEAGKQEVTMDTYNGPRLLFTLRATPDQVPAVLDDFLKKGTLGSLNYIDFRSPKRAFYE